MPCRKASGEEFVAIIRTVVSLSSGKLTREETNRLPVVVEILFQHGANRDAGRVGAKTERGIVNGKRQLDGAGQCSTAFKKHLVCHISPDHGTVVFRDLCDECVQRNLKTSRISVDFIFYSK